MKLNKCAQSESNQEQCGTCIKHEDCNYYKIKSTTSQNAYCHASGKSHIQITIEIDNSKNSSLSRLWKNILFFLAQNSKVILFQTPESHFHFFCIYNIFCVVHSHFISLVHSETFGFTDETTKGDAIFLSQVRARNMVTGKNGHKMTTRFDNVNTAV